MAEALRVYVGRHRIRRLRGCVNDHSGYEQAFRRVEPEVGSAQVALRRSTIVATTPRFRLFPWRASDLLRAVFTPYALVWFASTLFATFFSVLASLRFDRFLNRRFDLGNLTQVISNTAAGDLYEVTEITGRQIVRLGVHVDLTLALFAPLWWVWPSPKMLIIVQVTWFLWVLFLSSGWAASTLRQTGRRRSFQLSI